MTDFLKLLNDLSELETPQKVDVSTINLNNKADRDKVRKTINELKENKLFSLLLSVFSDDESDIFDKITEELNALDKADEEKNKPVIKRPSETISTNAGLQIHKLVQEYIDTMIKPYNPKNNGLSSKQINDAYAGLYEFACWIFQHK